MAAYYTELAIAWQCFSQVIDGRLLTNGIGPSNDELAKCHLKLGLAAVYSSK